MTETEPGPDGVPVPDPSQIFFFEYPTRPVPKVENVFYFNHNNTVHRMRNAGKKHQIKLTITHEIIIISSLIMKSDVEQMQ